MVIPDGHVLEKCCKCEATQLVHCEHRADRGRAERWTTIRGPLPDVKWATR